MRFIPTRVHGVVDYLIGVLLIVAPWLLGFAYNGPETWVPVIVGAAVIVYSIFTDYEAGLFGAISMPAHLWLDGIGGLFLLISPWLFDFTDIVWVPHFVVGLIDIGAALLTHLRPSHGAVSGPHGHMGGGTLSHR